MRPSTDLSLVRRPSPTCVARREAKPYEWESPGTRIQRSRNDLSYHVTKPSPYEWFLKLFGIVQ